jgi:hypothetical protein
MTIPADHDDPRDAPGTDDHVHLLHPHGLAMFHPWPYLADDLPSYTLATIAAHRAISTRYLVICTENPATRLPPLCRTTHVETLPAGVADLPHSMREGIAGIVAELERDSGARVALLRAWRHFGEDCEGAEADRDCRPA